MDVWCVCGCHDLRLGLPCLDPISLGSLYGYGVLRYGNRYARHAPNRLMAEVVRQKALGSYQWFCHVHGCSRKCCGTMAVQLGFQYDWWEPGSRIWWSGCFDASVDFSDSCSFLSVVVGIYRGPSCIPNRLQYTPCTPRRRPLFSLV